MQIDSRGSVNHQPDVRTSWFLINSLARRNISTNEFTWHRTRWIVAKKPPCPSHPQYNIVFLHVVPIHHRNHTTVQSLVFLFQWVAMCRCNDILSLEHGTYTLLIERLPVARQFGHFPQTMQWCSYSGGFFKTLAPVYQIHDGILRTPKSLH
jgi:hypothetical protein